MLILRKEAEDDMEKAYEWYEEKRTSLGVEFLYEVESTFEIIEKSRGYTPRCSRMFAGCCAVVSLIRFTSLDANQTSL